MYQHSVFLLRFSRAYLTEEEHLRSCVTKFIKILTKRTATKMSET